MRSENCYLVRRKLDRSGSVGRSWSSSRLAWRVVGALTDERIIQFLQPACQASRERQLRESAEVRRLRGWPGAAAN
jgi:hypothetical protein